MGKRVIPPGDRGIEEIDLREANKREQAEKPIRKRPRRLRLVKSEPDAAPR